MADFHRRNFLHLGLGGLASGALSSFSPLRAMARGAALGPATNDAAKLLIIFMRGGMDGVLAVIPQGDTTYNAARNTGPDAPWIPTSVAGGSGSGVALTSFADLHPAMNKWLRNGPIAAGKMAFLHQVGNSDGGRSHFTEMERMETAQPTVGAAQLGQFEGFVARMSTALNLPASTPIGTISVSGLMQRMFSSTSNPQFHLRDLEATVQQLLPSTVGTHLGGWTGLAGSAEEDVHALGELAFDAVAEIQAAPPISRDPNKFPDGSNSWPLALAPGANPNPLYIKFFRDLESAVHLLNTTPCQVAGVELGGFDTHSNELIPLRERLEVIAFGMNSVFEVGPAVTTLAMSEFGRGARANGNDGTDHGLGGVMFACGPTVVGTGGGVFNCDSTTWNFQLDNQALLPVNDPAWNAVPVRTHYLTVFDEILDRLFQLRPAARQQVLPGLVNVPAGAPATRLGFLQ